MTSTYAEKEIQFIIKYSTSGLHYCKGISKESLKNTMQKLLLPIIRRTFTESL